jgi:uncharacterized protein
VKKVLKQSLSGVILAGFVLLIWLLFTGCRRTVTDIYPSGKPKSEMQYLGKKLDGLSVWYYENGNKQLEISYKNGVADGKLIRWLASGGKSLEENYSGGLRNGKSTGWDDRGNRIEEKNFVNDTMDGGYSLWYPSGMLKIKGEYAKGLFQGRWDYYNETGLKVGEGNFMKGSGKQNAFSRNGKPTHEITYRNNLKDGTETYFDAAGKPGKQVEWKAGKFVSEKNL